MVFKLSCVVGIKDINQSNRHYNAYWRGPNKEADEKSAYNNVQVGDGPQHREFRKEILQAMRVGVGRRNIFCENIISVPLPMQLSTSYVWRILDK